MEFGQQIINVRDRWRDRARQHDSKKKKWFS